MRLLGRYVFREILTSSILGTLLATFVIFLHGADALFKVLVGSNPGPRTVIQLLALAMPPVLPLTIPFGVLIGILIGLGRMASDGEIVAMRAAGVSSRKVVLPVVIFALLGAGMAAWASLRLTPYSYHETAKIIGKLGANMVTADIPPRVFNEDFPNTILFVDNVHTTAPGAPAVWDKVFIADVTKPEQRKTGSPTGNTDGPVITVAQKAIAVSQPKDSRIELDLRDYSTHEMGKDLKSRDFASTRGRQILQGRTPEEQTTEKPRAMSTRSLLHYKGPDKIEASIELHQRFALPVACLMLALVGIPLGVGTRKGGKSGAYVTAVFLGFFGYWLSTVALVNMAKQKSLSPQVASWLPDLAFGLLGVVLLSRMERPGDSDFLSAVTRAFDWFLKLFKPRAEQAKTPEKPRLSGWRIPLLPQIVDTYILTNFLFYLGMVLAAFVSMILMFNFFELTGDMIRHNISMLTMGKYLFFLTPMLVYDTMPICILVAVLVNLAVLSKNNEITAFKACGVSLYRMAAPILIVSTVLSAGLFALDFYYLPAANRTQDRLRDVIKARPPQTYYRPDRTWKMGKGFRIYYYSAFDQGMMVDANVFELQPATFQVVKQIRAARARWNPSKKEWIFEDGWYSEFTGRLDRNGVPFETQAFPELKEDPTYFLKENLLTSQMNFVQLQKYIEDLDQSGYGYDTVKLRVHLFQKYSVPLFATIMAMIAIPFGFLVGRRGAMTGVGFSIGVALAYWGISKLFENIGELNQLPPSVAAWAPDVVFAFLGLYFLLRMKS